MLTEEQKIQLEPLTHHKYGNILSSAMMNWNYYDIICKAYGIDFDRSFDLKYFIKSTRYSGCCLLGAASIGKPYTGYFYESISIVFNIPRDEHTDRTIMSMERGFDGLEPPLIIYNKEAYYFGQRIRKILQPKEFVELPTI